MSGLRTHRAERSGARVSRAVGVLGRTIWRERLMAVAACVLALLLVGAATLTRPWHALENKTFDVLTAWAAPEPSALPLVILAIDEASFRHLQLPWPFPRSLHAQLLRRLHEEGAVAVGLDVLFAEPSIESEDAALTQAVADSGPVVLASLFEQDGSGSTAVWTEVLPLERLRDAGAVAGDTGLLPHEDFVVRRTPPQMEHSFAMRLAQRATGATEAEGAALHRSDWLGYRGPRGSFETRSYYQALVPGLLPPGFFQGKVVLVGRSARTALELVRSQADMFNSPFRTTGGDMLFPGVELHATLVDNLVTGNGLRSVSRTWSLVWVLLMLPVVLWAQWRLHTAVVAALVATLVVLMGAVSWGLFGQQRLWWPPLAPAVSLLAVYAAAALVDHASVRRRARQTRAMFAQYVPPTVVSRLIAQPGVVSLGGEVREVTLMFTDLAEFTSLSERLSAEQTVEVLTAYFNAMTPIVHATGGTLDKYIGDALMAFWGAPLHDAQHAEHAVRAALEMQRAMPALVADLAARGLPPLQMRIGLHTGRVVVGNVGSQQRFSYTAIGDAVNLAARLEGVNKAFGTGIVLSSATAAQLPPEIALRPLDDVIVKGKTAVVRVFTPCDDAALCAASDGALRALHARDWDAAQRHLEALLQCAPSDRAALRLQQRLAAARSAALAPEWTPAVALEKL